MARMHSRDKGKSGSKKPEKTTKPSWSRYNEKEVSLLVAKLAKEGMMPSKIGTHLRDVYGIPDVKLLTNKSMTQLLEEKKLAPEVPEDLLALFKKYLEITKHIEENHKDMTAKRGMQLTQSKIMRLVKYYKRTGRLPKDFKFDLASIKLLIG